MCHHVVYDVAGPRAVPRGPDRRGATPGGRRAAAGAPADLDGAAVAALPRRGPADHPDGGRRGGGRARDRGRRRRRGPLDARRPGAPGRHRAHHPAAVPARVGRAGGGRCPGRAAPAPRAVVTLSWPGAAG